MIIEKTYKTNSKYQIAIDSNGLPFTGSYWGNSPESVSKEDYSFLEQGVNIILSGDLFFKGIEKGRSSVVFSLEDELGRKYHLSTSSVEEFFNQLSLGNASVENIDGKVLFKCKWTVIKQGSQVSLLPMKES